uniref:Mitochondrial cardiolipin hydrolase n=1 Tax=Chlamydomonas euryale TaxID=1486919 RepID=A0A7R9YVT9_9CHLO|mmetsp:Transcript_30077/g.89183  ORF Transcript_30077/g.89183 Transcript_30077/m.89183 type:complete len:197 (+) Transcript_30077:298-888(+)
MGCLQSTPASNYAAPPQANGAAASIGHVDVIFFPEPSGKMPCRNANTPRGCHRHNCNYEHGPTLIGRFLQYLNSATRTLDICVFTITCDEISDAVMALHKRGVKVRVITDDDQANSLGSDIDKFRQCGIPVKVDHSKTHMHHKFAVIDHRLLMNGSFNWTRQAVLGNQENVVMIENPKLVHDFSQCFEKLWSQFRA